MTAARNFSEANRYIICVRSFSITCSAERGSESIVRLPLYVSVCVPPSPITHPVIDVLFNFRLRRLRSCGPFFLGRRKYLWPPRRQQRSMAVSVRISSDVFRHVHDMRSCRNNRCTEAILGVQSPHVIAYFVSILKPTWFSGDVAATRITAKVLSESAICSAAVASSGIWSQGDAKVYANMI